MILVAYSILLAVEVLVIAAAISNAVPYGHNPLYDRLFARFLDQSVFPERELLLYAVFLGACLLIHFVAVRIYRARLLGEDFTRALGRLAVAQAFWVAVEIFAAFKIYIYQGPLWAKGLFYGAVGLSLLSKIFWPEIRRWVQWIYERYAALPKPAAQAGWLDGVAVILIGSFFVMAHWDHCLAVMFAWDQFAGLKQFFGVTLWGKIFGLSAAPPSAQVGFMAAAHILYFSAVYGLLRFWFKDIILAVCGVVLAVKLQCFNWGTHPMVWIYPQSTVLAHAWDALFFICFWFYLRAPGVFYIIGMTMACALAIAFTPFSGVCLWGAYAAAMALNVRSDYAAKGIYFIVRSLMLAIVVSPAMGWGLLTALHGQWAWPTGQGDITQQLARREYFSFFTGFVVLAVYAACALMAGLRWRWDKTPGADVFVMALSFYGLGTFSQYALAASAYGYYTYILPLIVLVVFLVKQVLDIVPRGYRVPVRLVLTGLTVVGLLTNNLCLRYFLFQH